MLRRVFSVIVLHFILPFLVDGAPSWAQTPPIPLELRSLYRSAEEGDAAAQFALGARLEAGQGLAPDLAGALNWYRRAAEKGHGEAAAALGSMYINGRGVERDDAAALRWFEQAASQRVADGINGLGHIYDNGFAGRLRDPARAIELFREAAGLGSRKAQYNLAMAYLGGTAVPMDVEAARHLLAQAAEQDFSPAQRQLGLLYETGRGVSQDDRVAVEWYRRAASNGLADGQYALGWMMEFGRGLSRDATGAAKWYALAAGQSHSLALLRLALLHLDGRGVAKDEAQAEKLLSIAADQGLAEAQLQYARFLARRNPPRYAEAAPWYKRAADQGQAEAQDELGDLYYYGRGVPQNDAQAVSWFRRAAEQGNAGSQYSLGWMLERGRGVGQDKAAALVWYRQSAEQGNGLARNSLGDLYAAGEGVEQNWVDAVRWYRLAAEQGNRNARASLGKAYLNGTGLTKDPSLAARWLRKAADQDHVFATSLLAFMFETMEVTFSSSMMRSKAVEAIQWYRWLANQRRRDIEPELTENCRPDLPHDLINLPPEALQSLAMAGNPNALILAAWRLESGRDGAKAPERARLLYERAAALGCPAAANRLGVLYEEGRGVVREEWRAVEYFERAAEAGVVDAMVNLASMYETGRVEFAPQDVADRRAFELYERAARLDHPVGQARLATMLWPSPFGVPVTSEDASAARDTGKGIPRRDAAESIALARKALRQGVSPGWEMFISSSRSSTAAADELSSDDESSFRRSAREQGLEEFEKGLSDVSAIDRIRQSNGDESDAYPTRDFGQAVAWYTKAAEKGDTYSKGRLGNLYVQGKGFKRDLARGVKLLSEAAEANDRRAQLKLALLYELGEGVPRDLLKAEHLYRSGYEASSYVAAFGLARLRGANAWETDRNRRARLIRTEDTSHSRKSRVTISWKSFTTFTVRDKQGRRYGTAQSQTGSYSVPDQPGLYVTGTIKDLVFAVDGQESPLAEAMKACATCDDIAGLAITPDDIRAGRFQFLSKKDIAGEIDAETRILLTAVPDDTISTDQGDETAATVDVFDPATHLFGFMNVVATSERPFRVPDAPGLVLRVGPGRSAELTIDRTRRLSITAPAEHEIRVPLNAERLLRVQPHMGTTTAKLKQGESIPYFVDAAGTSLAELIRFAPPRDFSKDDGPGNTRIVAGFVGINWQIAALTARLGGQVEREEEILSHLYRRNLRIYGPYGEATLSNLSGLGRIDRLRGRFTDAEEKLARAKAFYERESGRDSASYRQTLVELGELELARGNLIYAEQYGQLALAYAERSGDPGQSEIALLIDVYRNRGEFSKVDTYAGRWLLQAEHERFGENIYIKRGMDLLQALRAQGRHEEVRPLVERVHQTALRETIGGQDLKEPLPHPINMQWVEQTFGRCEVSTLCAQSFEHLADVYFLMGRHAEAVPLEQRALGTMINVFGADHPRSGDKYRRLAELSLKLGNTAEALILARKATEIFAQLTEEGGSHELARNPWTGPAAAFEAHLEILDALLRDSPPNPDALRDEQFRVIQLAHASAAGDAIRHLAARLSDTASAVGALLRDRQGNLERMRASAAELAAQVQQTGTERKPAVEQALREERTALKARLAATNAALLRQAPDLSVLLMPRPFGLDEVKRRLGDREALFAVNVGQRHSYALVVTRERAFSYPVDWSAAALGQAASQLRRGLDRRHPQATAAFDVDLSHQLYRSLLLPAEPLLASVDHIIVIPSGPLEAVPLGVLVRTPPAQPVMSMADYRDVGWLAATYALSISPTVESLLALRQKAIASKATLAFLGVGNPVLGFGRVPREGVQLAQRPEYIGRAGTANLRSLRELPSLPDTAAELQQIAGSLVGAGPSTLLLGPDATETKVKTARDIGQYRIVAFATHGLVGGELAGQSEPGLVMTPPAVASAGDDGLLTASEIAALELDAEWVVLSACNTAGADGAPGAEGLSGLARAFFLAGTRALLVSHWEVASAAAVDLTTSAFEELRKRPQIGKAAAIRHAIERMIETNRDGMFAHPRFWAPFVVVGEGGASPRE